MASNITKLSESALERGKPRRMGVAVEQTVLLVLGMHRSGTSAATRVMSLLGADLPSNLMLPKAENNEAGFWESLDTYLINDKILQSAGSRWDDWRRFNPDWIRSPTSQAFRLRALEILEQEFSRSPFFVLKDPRICRLLPFWLDVFREFGSEVKCVLPLRNPLEIAASLEKRDGISPAKSYMLWLRHVVEVEKATRKLPRVFITYDDLLDDWRGTVGQVSARLGIAWPRRSAIAEVEIDKFLDERHRHHSIDQVGIDQRSDVAGWVRGASRALARLLSDPYAKKPQKRLDAIRVEFNRASDALGAVLLAEELARNEAEQIASENETRSSELADQLGMRDERIVELEKLTAGQQDLVEELRANIADRDERIVELEKLTAGQQDLVEELRANIADRDERIVELEKLTAGQQDLVEELRANIADRDERIVELEKLTAGQQDLVEELRANIADRDERIVELKKLTAGQQDLVEELRTNIADRDEYIEKLDQQAYEMRAVEVATESEVSKLQKTLTAMDVEFQRLRDLSSKNESRLKSLKSENEIRVHEIENFAKQVKDLEGQTGDLKSRNEALVSQARSVLDLRNKALTRLNAMQTVSRKPSHIPGPGSDAIQRRLSVGFPPGNVCGAKLSFRDRLRLRKQARRLLASHLFDEGWYVDRYPEVVLNGDDPLWFWLIRGWKESHDPNPLFDMHWYRKTNPDVAATEINPLFHFMKHGAKEQRDPGPMFSCRWYLHDNPDVEAAGVNPLAHYLKYGCSEGRKPNPFFDPDWYRDQAPSIAGNGIDLLRHYLAEGASEGHSPGSLFDGDWYLKQYPDVMKSGMNPLEHYLKHGRFEGRNPNSLFDGPWYSKIHPDVGNAGFEPFEHFILYGAKEGRDPSPLFDTDWYVSQNPEVMALGVNPLAHYLATCFTNGTVTSPKPVLRTKEGRKSADSDGVTDAFGLRGAPSRLPFFSGQQDPVPGQKNLLLCAHAANNQLFGGERSFIDLLEMLAATDINVHVVVPRNNPDYISRIRKLALEVVHIPYKYWAAGGLPDQTTVAALLAYMMHRNIDLVHVNTIVVREPLLAARKLGIPAITHVRESIVADKWMSEMLGVSEQEIVEEVMQTTDFIIANSKRTAAEFKKEGATFVVPNNFDLERLDIGNDIDPTEIKVGLISSNLPKKGIEDFAKLAKACRELIPNLVFCLIGPKNQHVLDLIVRQESGDLTDNLRFVDYQQTPEDALKHANIVMSLSHFAESFGRTVAEGLAARRPALVYDLGAAQDLVQTGTTGYVIPYPEWEEAIPLLQKLSRDPRQIREMGQQGRTFIEANYSRQVGINALTDAYEEILRVTAERSAQSALSDSRVFPARIAQRDVGTEKDDLRLAYFCWHFPVPSETFVLNELRLLVDQGVDVKVYCKQSPYADFKPDFEIIWEKVGDASDLASKLKESRRTFVHAHFTYPTVTNMVWPACDLAGIPFTFIAHAQDIFKYENDRKNRISEVVSSSYCRAVFTLGTYHRDFLIERSVPPEKIIINPNGIDPERFAFELPLGAGRSPNKKVCAVHRLTRKKGLHNLVEAAGILNDKSIEFNIFGYGDEEQNLRSLIEERGLANVKLCGALKTTAEVVEVLRRHDLFASPSIRTEDGDMDGIPTAVVESMAAGTPVIVTDVASIPDLVQDQVTGIVVAPDSPEDLAKGITRFFSLDDESVRSLALNARRAVELRHDVRRLTDTLKRVWSRNFVDIVIVSWNNVDELKEVIARIFDNTKTPFHLTICDNRSDIDVLVYLSYVQQSFDNVTVVFNSENKFVGPGTNSAILQGSGKYIIYVCGKEGFSVAEGWETSMIAFMDENPHVGLGGTLGHSPSYLKGTDFSAGIAEFGHFRNRQFADENPDRIFHHVQGGLFILRREMFDQIGGFNEDVPHAYTDVEYSFYAESKGWKLGNVPSVLALYNKTVPNIWSRVHEGIKVLHPPLLSDLALLDKIARRETAFCNVCGWSGDEFMDANNNHVCPQCKSNPEHRTLYRYLAESVFPFRRLPALLVDPHPCLSEFWNKSFQGPLFSEQDFRDILHKKGRLENSPDSLSLAVGGRLQEKADLVAQMLREFRRLIRGDGRLLLFANGRGDAQDRLSDISESAGFEIEDEVLYASSVVAYSTNRLLVLAPCSKVSEQH